MSLHSPLRRLVSLWLAVLVLLTSVGLTVQRQTCRMSGRSLVDVSVAHPAAPVGCTGMLAPAAPVAKDGCCDFSRHLHKLSTPAAELAAKVLVPAPALLALLPTGLRWAGRPMAALLPAGSPRWFAADSSPPPLGGRGLLAFVCTLVV